MELVLLDLVPADRGCDSVFDKDDKDGVNKE